MSEYQQQQLMINDNNDQNLNSKINQNTAFKGQAFNEDDDDAYDQFINSYEDDFENDDEQNDQVLNIDVQKNAKQQQSHNDFSPRNDQFNSNYDSFLNNQMVPTHINFKINVNDKGQAEMDSKDNMQENINAEVFTPIKSIAITSSNNNDNNNNTSYMLENSTQSTKDIALQHIPSSSSTQSQQQQEISSNLTNKQGKDEIDINFGQNQHDEDDLDYGEEDEIIDLGDDVQPFSMTFKNNKLQQNTNDIQHDKYKSDSDNDRDEEDDDLYERDEINQFEEDSDQERDQNQTKQGNNNGIPNFGDIQEFNDLFGLNTDKNTNNVQQQVQDKTLVEDDFNQNTNQLEQDLYENNDNINDNYSDNDRDDDNNNDEQVVNPYAMDDDYSDPYSNSMMFKSFKIPKNLGQQLGQTYKQNDNNTHITGNLHKYDDNNSDFENDDDDLIQRDDNDSDDDRMVDINDCKDNCNSNSNSNSKINVFLNQYSDMMQIKNKSNKPKQFNQYSDDEDDDEKLYDEDVKLEQLDVIDDNDLKTTSNNQMQQPAYQKMTSFEEKLIGQNFKKDSNKDMLKGLGGGFNEEVDINIIDDNSDYGDEIDQDDSKDSLSKQQQTIQDQDLQLNIQEDYNYRQKVDKDQLSSSKIDTVYNIDDEYIQEVQTQNNLTNEDQNSNDNDEDFEYNKEMFSRFSSTFKFNPGHFKDLKPDHSNSSQDNNEEQEVNLLQKRNQITYGSENPFQDVDRFDFDEFQPIQDDTFEEFGIQDDNQFEDDPIPMQRKSPYKDKKQHQIQAQNILGDFSKIRKEDQQFDNLALVKGGASKDIDIRQGISVEKYFDTQKQIEVRQHKLEGQSEEEPEMLTNKNIEIIKQTKHDKFFEKITDNNFDEDQEDEDVQRLKQQRLKVGRPIEKKQNKNDDDDDDSSDDSDLDRDEDASGRDQDLDELFGFESKTKNQNNQILPPDDGRTHIETNTDALDWISGVKYEGWKIIDGARPNQEVTEKCNGINAKVNISKRLNLIMENIFSNIIKRSQQMHLQRGQEMVISPNKRQIVKGRAKFQSGKINYEFGKIIQEDQIVINSQQINYKLFQEEQSDFHNYKRSEISQQKVKNYLIQRKSIISLPLVPIRQFGIIEYPLVSQDECYFSYRFDVEQDQQKISINCLSFEILNQKANQYEESEIPLKRLPSIERRNSDYDQSFKTKVIQDQFNIQNEVPNLLSNQSIQSNQSDNIIPFEISFEHQNRSISQHSNINSVHSNSNKKLRISRQSIQFINQLSKDQKSRVSQLKQDDQLPQRSSSTFAQQQPLHKSNTNVIQNAKDQPKISIIQSMQQKPIIGKKFPVNMIKIKLANGEKTKPLLSSNQGSNNNGNKKDIVGNNVLRTVTKSIQNRVKDIHAIDPKLLKIRQSILNSGMNSKSPGSSSSHALQQLGTDPKTNQAFQDVKKLIMSRTRQKVDLYNSAVSDTQQKAKQLISDSNIIKPISRFSQLKPIQKITFTRQSEILPKEVKPLIVQDFDNSKSDRDSFIQQHSQTPFDYYKDRSPQGYNSNIHLNSNFLNDSESLDEIMLPPEDCKFDSIHSNDNEDSSKSQKQLHQREFKNTILNQQHVKSDSKIQTQISPQHSKPVKLKGNDFKTEDIIKQLNNKKQQESKHLINNFLS